MTMDGPAYQDEHERTARLVASPRLYRQHVHATMRRLRCNATGADLWE
jgi:hypothetical protein